MAEIRQGDLRTHRRHRKTAKACAHEVPTRDKAEQCPFEKGAAEAARKVLRRGRWGDTEPARLATLPPGWSPRQCQFIAGDPSAEDACKCGVAAIGRGPYYGPLAALLARYAVDTARLVGRILRARAAGLEGPTVRALALLTVLSPLLGACAGVEGKSAAGIDAARALEDRKTRVLLLAHETASLARCASNLSSIYRVAPQAQTDAIAAWCKALALREREALENAPSVLSRSLPRTPLIRPE